MQKILNKVPEVTLGFWLVKIMSTTVGETAADYLAVGVGWGIVITSIFMAVLFILALAFQFFLPRYVPSAYWVTVVLVSIVGTQITDILTDKLEVSLYITTAVFGLLLAIIFAVWYLLEKTLTVQTIITRRRELFYWGAILCTFALGTAAGDLATEVLGLGFKYGVVVFGLLITFIGAAFYLGLNSVLAFWMTYILTRPLGASLGDLLSQSKEYGGMGLGAAKTSILFFIAIIFIVGLLTFNQNKKFHIAKLNIKN
ncbi:MAG: hypothetical protein WA160_01805 [Pseudobdellovibrio sp.]